MATTTLRRLSAGFGVLAALVGSGVSPVVSTAAAAQAPDCANPNRNGSMLLAGALTVSPQPGTDDAMPKTQISLLGAPVEDLSDVVVTGAHNSVHGGKLEPYSEGDGASYVLAKPFAEGEEVSVHLTLHEGKRTHVVGWRFSVGYKAGLGTEYHKPAEAVSSRVAGAPASRHVAGAPTKPAAQPKAPGPSQSFHSQPNLHPPDVYVTTNKDEGQPGYLFLSPFFAGQAGPMILNDEGGLVWFDPVNTGSLAASKATNLQVQSYEGEPVLTWWQDPVDPSQPSKREPEDVLFNEEYKQIATVRAGNGLVDDVHEFQITPEGTALLAIKHDISCNLSGIGGSSDGSVWDDVIQEVDIATGLVRWEWNSLDHASLAEAYDSVHYATSSYPFDFFHLNSIQTLEGDALLVSSRNTWTIYDVNRRTGVIGWRLGGKHSNFAMGPGTATAWQHDARQVSSTPSKHEMLISVFDNGATPKEHPQSRAVIELVNTAKRTATLQREIRHSPLLLSGSQGSVQMLGDGNTVVGWGQKPWFSEYSASGEVLFDAHLAPIEQSYRALRYEWSGKPATPPKIAVEREKSGKLAVYVSWNGATEVASWSILEGASTSTLKPVATHPLSGFETKIEVPAHGPFVEAQALNAAGEAIGTSAAERASS
ncbi:MAG TPA: arylsulfotransferase family protein [Solirubrobacteraceae bacterium]|jgi:hypothetical protein